MSRPKDWVKAWGRSAKPDDDCFHIVFQFAYWLEGQDRVSGKERAKIVPAEGQPDANDIATDPEPQPDLPHGVTHVGQGFFDIEPRGEGWSTEELRAIAESADRLMWWHRYWGDA